MNKSKENKDYEGVKAFLIARVSDPSQREALPAQELRLNEYSERLQLNAEMHSFDETAYKEDRVKFLVIIDKVVQYPDYFIIVFDKIDRLTRDVSSEVVRTLKNLVKAGRCELHFPSDGLVFHQHSPAHDKTRLDMGMVFGGYYSAAISDNVKRKIEQKLHDGEYPGKSCVGYKNIKTLVDGKEVKNIIPDPDRKDYIIKAFELRLEAKSYRTIAKILRNEGLRSNTKQQKPVGQSQIETMLKNPFYYGVMKYDGGLYPHKYEPIIKKRLFDMVQQVNNERTNDRGKTDTKKVFTFNGILKCSNCGCSISSYEQKGHIYMRCTKAKNVPCNQPHVSEAEIMPQVTELLDKLKISEGIVNQVLDVLKSEHDNIQTFYKNAIVQTRAEYNRLQKKLDTLYEDRLDGRITVADYDKYVTKYKAEMDDLDRKLVDYTNNDKSFIVTAEYLLRLASNAKKLFESSQPQQKNKILRLLLANLTLNQKKLQLHLLKPFSGLVSDTKSTNWLAVADTLRTAYMDYDEYKVNSIKELLVAV
jgi:site-specific DNA recombinase